MSTPAKSARRVAVIATGDELVTGSFVDTNSAHIARALFERGYVVSRLCVLGDDEGGLVGTLAALADDHVGIVITGGLGPTLDDVTRHACARAANVSLVRSEEVVAGLRQMFAQRGMSLPVTNERQALFPAGADVLPNAFGTAPGFVARLGTALVFALPGPPREMQPMLASEVLPRLHAHAAPAGSFARRRFYLHGLTESRFAELSGAWMERGAEPLLGVTSGRGILSATLVARAASDAEAERSADVRAAEFRARFSRWIFSEDEPALELVLGRLLVERGLTVTIAESCTGGLVAERLTRVPGISAVLDAAFVTYANRAKTELVGVEPALLERHGAVSPQVAGAMALGAASRARARLAIAVTGIAGPSGGTAEKPVGLVWCAVALDGRAQTEERRFAPLGRDLVREFACNAALDLARRVVLALGPV
ncbi:MAG: CinA family nicotinamide mononucleotide deamidase-related protein [Planctomycetota bacterium]